MGVTVLVWFFVKIDNDRQVLTAFVIRLPVFSGFIGVDTTFYRTEISKAF
jgi:hypothetical protein